MLAGECGIKPISKFDTADYKAKVSAWVKDFDPLVHFEAMEVRKLDPFMQYGLVATKEAIEDSRIKGNVDPERFGTYVTSGQGGFGTIIESAYTIRDKGASRVSPAAIPMQGINMLAGQIAAKYGAKGASLPIVTACATSAHGIGEAFFAIRAGRLDAIVAGGAEASAYPLVIAGFQNMYAISRSEDANSASIPFDKRRAGFVVGEGAAILVLEELEHAKARGAKIYCEVVGYGNTCDAFHITAPHPEGDGLARAVRLALECANLKDREKVYINAHGTGTELNDKVETLVFKTVFGKRAYAMPCSSIKSMTGHMMGAAGAMEAIVCAKVLATGKVPPTINYKEPDPDCDLDYVTEGARKFAADVALSTNAGFGGHNCALVFRRYK
jgi:3-oxoacyl-[acyl-carrier-protein] synthase II